MSKWYVEEIDNEIFVLNKEEANDNMGAVTLNDFLRSNLESPDASFYNYLYQFPQVGNEIGIKVESIYPVLEKAETLLNTLSKDEVHNELCQYNKLDEFYKYEAKLLVKFALVEKANEFLKAAISL